MSEWTCEKCGKSEHVNALGLPGVIGTHVCASPTDTVSRLKQLQGDIVANHRNCACESDASCPSWLAEDVILRNALPAIVALVEAAEKTTPYCTCSKAGGVSVLTCQCGRRLLPAALASLVSALGEEKTE